MPLKDRLWKFRKRHRIHFFLIEFSVFSRINSAAKIFPLPTSHTHTHITPCPPPLHSSLLLPSSLPSSSPLCVLPNEISTRRSRMIRSPHIGLAWLQRVAGKDAASLQRLILVTTEIQQPDWIPSLTAHTLTHSHTHTLTHSHTLPLSQTHSHPNTFSRRNARACGGACYTLEACMNYLQLKG